MDILLQERGSKAACIKLMLELEEKYGREFWVVSVDDAARTYWLCCSQRMLDNPEIQKIIATNSK